MSVPNGGATGMPEQRDPVLLVEDNPVNQKSEMFLLERFGLRAEIANNGKEAVAAVSSKKYSVILMDCHMPEMDGFEATKAIRKLEALNGTYTPIIALTALAMSGDQERCISAGMDDYISKPVDVNLLKIKLNHWLRTDVVFRNQEFARKLRTPQTIGVAEADPIDIKELEDFYGPGELAQMLRLFVSDAADKVKRMQFFIKECRAKEVAGLAHELKASCASIGAKQLSRQCLLLEQAVGQLNWGEAQETFSVLQKSFEMLIRFVNPIVIADQTLSH